MSVITRPSSRPIKQDVLFQSKKTPITSKRGEEKPLSSRKACIIKTSMDVTKTSLISERGNKEHLKTVQDKRNRNSRQSHYS